MNGFVSPEDVNENPNDGIALEISDLLTKTIEDYLKGKFPWVSLTPQSYTVISVFPRTLNDNKDILWVAWKVQINFNGRVFYIELPEKYYTLERKLWKTTEWDRLLTKILNIFKKPSSKNRRWRVKDVIKRMAAKAAWLVWLNASR